MFTSQLINFLCQNMKFDRGRNFMVYFINLISQIENFECDEQIDRNKENTANTFYRSYILPEERQYASSFKQFDNNLATFESIQSECDSLLVKLSEKIQSDEHKIQFNYQELNQISREIQQHHMSSNSDKQTENIIKGQKQAIKELYKQDKEHINSTTLKYVQQIRALIEGVDFKEKEIEYEKEERDDQWSKLIDSFEKDIIDAEKQLKGIRSKQEEVFDRSSLDMYNLEEKIERSISEETTSRKKEHQTIIKLVAECIENMRYIY